MKGEEIYIKNMVCSRCIKVVSEEIKNLGFEIKSIVLGHVELTTNINEEELNSIKSVLEKNSFELLSSRSSRIISLIKIEIIRVIHHNEEFPSNIKFSDYLSNKIGKDYSYLSNLFSNTEGITIEKYMILQKTERVKELLLYDELSLNEIAYQLGYSSVQYLSLQFKSTTGLTPTSFKNHHKNRISLDNVINPNRI